MIAFSLGLQSPRELHMTKRYTLSSLSPGKNEVEKKTSLSADELPSSDVL